MMKLLKEVALGTSCASCSREVLKSTKFNFNFTILEVRNVPFTVFDCCELKMLSNLAPVDIEMELQP